MAKSQLPKMPEYRAWSNLKNRCLNPRNKSYDRYGGRGITVCDRWMKFENFLADMGYKPSEEHSIDRINVDGPYSPENCRWSDRHEQANNKRNNRVLTVQGKSMTIAQWSRETGLSEDAIERRINLLGWSDEDAVTKPHRGWGGGKTRDEFASQPD